MAKTDASVPCAPCPHCGTVPESLGVTIWGTGQQTLPYAAFVCLACGGLAILWLDTGRLAALAPEYEALLEARAPALWERVVAVRSRLDMEDDDAP